MKNAVLWQRFEGAVFFIAGLVLFFHYGLDLSWWIAFLIFFAPDLSFAGYLLGPKTGAVAYNLIHVYALGAAVLVAGVTLAAPGLAAIGSLWLAHSGFDRMLGYGLKSPEGFTVTHLGRIGPAADR